MKQKEQNPSYCIKADMKAMITDIKGQFDEEIMDIYNYVAANETVVKIENALSELHLKCTCVENTLVTKADKTEIAHIATLATRLQRYDGFIHDTSKALLLQESMNSRVQSDIQQIQTDIELLNGSVHTVNTQLPHFANQSDVTVLANELLGILYNYIYLR